MEMVNPKGRIVNVPEDKVATYLRFGFVKFDRHITPTGYTASIDDLEDGDTICLFRDFGGLGDIVIQSFIIKSLLDKYPKINIDYAIPQEFHSLFNGVTDSRLKVIAYKDVISDNANNRNKEYIDLNRKYALFKDISRPCIRYEKTLKDNNFDAMRHISRVDMWADFIGIDLHGKKLSSILRINPTHIPELGPNPVGIAYRSNMPFKDWPELVRVYHWLEKNGYTPYIVDNRVIGSYRFLKTDDFYQLLCAIKALNFMIAVDTGPLHMAAAMGVPVLGLFNVNDGEAYTRPYESAEYLNMCQYNKPCIGTKCHCCDAVQDGVCYPIDALDPIASKLKDLGWVDEAIDHIEFSGEYTTNLNTPTEKPKTIVFFPCYNRKFVLDYTLPLMRKAFPEATIWAFDDCSTEYDTDYLLQFVDKVYRNDRNLGVSRSFNSMMLRIPESGYDYIYKTDSDALCDPRLYDRLLDLAQLNNGYPVCCYNSSFHYRNRLHKKAIGNAEFRNNCPGISMFIPAKMFARVKPFHIPRTSAFDHEICKQLPPFVVSEISYVEHLGAGGMHSDKKDWYKDVASNPTDFLVHSRRVFLRSIGVNI